MNDTKVVVLGLSCVDKRSKTNGINCMTGSWLKLCGLSGPELPKTRSGRPSVAWIFSPPQSSEALPCRFPGICSAFPFGVAGKGSGMEKKKKSLLRPLWSHCKGGEQSAGSPPAAVGHICGQLSPRCSLRRSPARLEDSRCHVQAQTQ